MKPYYDLLEKDENVDPAEAWERVKPQIMSSVMYATWHRDFVAGGIGGGQGRFCSLGQIKCARPCMLVAGMCSWCSPEGMPACRIVASRRLCGNQQTQNRVICDRCGESGLLTGNSAKRYFWQCSMRLIIYACCQRAGMTAGSSTECCFCQCPDCRVEGLTPCFTLALQEGPEDGEQRGHARAHVHGQARRRCEHLHAAGGPAALQQEYTRVRVHECMISSRVLLHQRGTCRRFGFVGASAGQRLASVLALGRAGRTSQCTCKEPQLPLIEAACCGSQKLFFWFPGLDAHWAQDGLGVPVTPFQDPLHYPHGTKWMAPGAHISPNPCAVNASSLALLLAWRPMKSVGTPIL